MSKANNDVNLLWFFFRSWKAHIHSEFKILYIDFLEKFCLYTCHGSPGVTSVLFK